METETAIVPSTPAVLARREAVATTTLLDDPELIDKIFEFITIEFREMSERLRS